jgi:hypothetical protein
MARSIAWHYQVSYLTRPFVTSTNSKREADGTKWHP